VIDLTTGNTVATFEFESGIEEIFDIQVLPDARCVALGGERPDAGGDDEIWVVPAGTEPTAPTPAGSPLES